VNAATITRRSRSNLALAFISLGRERRRDITTFYAFCRLVDDIVDSSELSSDEKAIRLARFDYSEADLQDRQYDERFIRLMEFEAARAREFFARAAELLAAEDRHSMVAAEIMASIYRGLLGRIERDRFRVFEKEYRLGKLEKAGRIVAQLLKSL